MAAPFFTPLLILVAKDVSGGGAAGGDAGGDAGGNAGAEVTICNQRGLHARASAKFVKLAETFDAEIRVAKDGIEVCGSSIMGLMLLVAAPGDTIRVTASGPGAQEAVGALVQLVKDRFDEDG